MFEFLLNMYKYTAIGKNKERELKGLRGKKKRVGLCNILARRTNRHCGVVIPEKHLLESCHSCHRHLLVSVFITYSAIPSFLCIFPSSLFFLGYSLKHLPKVSTFAHQPYCVPWQQYWRLMQKLTLKLKRGILNRASSSPTKRWHSHSHQNETSSWVAHLFTHPSIQKCMISILYMSGVLVYPPDTKMSLTLKKL